MSEYQQLLRFCPLCALLPLHTAVTLAGVSEYLAHVWPELFT